MNRPRRLWDWIGRGGDISSLIGLALLAPAAIGVVVAVATYFLRSPDEALTIGIVVFLALQIALAVVMLVARRRAASIPDLDAQPTGGPSPDVRLVITNRGPARDIASTAEIMATRNHGNVYHHGKYVLPWYGANANPVQIGRNQSQPLQVALYNTYDQPGLHVGEVQLMEWSGHQAVVWDWFRWIREPGATLPEFDLTIWITDGQSARPLELRYTIRPSDPQGPIEMIARS